MRCAYLRSQTATCQIFCTPLSHSLLPRITPSLAQLDALVGAFSRVAPNIGDIRFDPKPPTTHCRAHPVCAAVRFNSVLEVEYNMKLLAANQTFRACFHTRSTFFSNINRGQISRLPSHTKFAKNGQPVISCHSQARVLSAQTVESPSRDQVITSDPANNITDTIFSKIGVNLHRQPGHPLHTIRNAIYEYFEQKNPGMFNKFDDFWPIVSVQANFDDILIPPDHISRSPNDTYYVNSETVLRCHTSAHQTELLRRGETAFLSTGDVYRRDSIDSTHYPIFHQVEGVRVFSEQDWTAAGMESAEFVASELKSELEGLAKHLFGDVECRWVDAYFPFTNPSFELEIFFKGEWMEVLGCGVMEQQILDANFKPGHKAWAFGLGLERLAMVLFNIPDIRLFWTNDPRFKKQFADGDLSAKFKQYSKFPPCFKDMTFWISPEFSENNLCELVRSIAGDLVEEVKLIDNFTHPKTGRTSHCYRIAYRSMERSLTDEEINKLQFEVRDKVASELKVELR